MNIGTGEIVIITAILILILGRDKMKDLARGTGQASKELKQASKELKSAFIEEEEPIKDKKPKNRHPKNG